MNASVTMLREVEQQFTQFEWQLTRLEPEEFARQWEDNTHKLAVTRRQKNVTRPSDEPPSGAWSFTPIGSNLSGGGDFNEAVIAPWLEPVPCLPR
jgi:hypothetical protein